MCQEVVMTLLGYHLSICMKGLSTKPQDYLPHTIHHNLHRDSCIKCLIGIRAIQKLLH
jgi:hypothetical protein